MLLFLQLTLRKATTWTDKKSSLVFLKQKASSSNPQTLIGRKPPKKGHPTYGRTLKPGLEYANDTRDCELNVLGLPCKVGEPGWATRAECCCPVLAQGVGLRNDDECVAEGHKKTMKRRVDVCLGHYLKIYNTESPQKTAFPSAKVFLVSLLSEDFHHLLWSSHVRSW